MQKAFRTILKSLSIKTLFLATLIVTVMLFNSGHFIFVRAYDSKIVILPGGFTLEEDASDLGWDGVQNAFTQDLNTKSGFKDFNYANSANIMSSYSKEFSTNFKGIVNVVGTGSSSDEVVDSVSTEDNSASSFASSSDEDLENVEDAEDGVVAGEGAEASADEDKGTTDDDETESTTDNSEETENTAETGEDIQAPIEYILPSETNEDPYNNNDPIVEIIDSPFDEIIPESGTLELNIGNESEATIEIIQQEILPTEQEVESQVENLDDDISFFNGFLQNVSKKAKKISQSFFSWTKTAFAQVATSTLDLIGSSTGESISTTEAILSEEENDEETASSSKKEKNGEIWQSIIFNDFSVPFDYSAVEAEGGLIKLRMSLSAFSYFGNDRLSFAYSIEDDDWEELGVLHLREIVSNKSTGDYLQYVLPDEIAWSDVANLQIRVSYITKEDYRGLTDDTRLEVYLDALWLEMEYDETALLADDDESTTTEDELKEEKAEKEREFTLEQLTERIDFNLGENPEFRFRFKKNRSFLAGLGASFLSLFYDEYGDFNIKAVVEDDSDSSLDESELPIEVEYLEDGEFRIKILELPRDFKPGMHSIRITLQDEDFNEGLPIDFSQDFTWGVLAFNTNKATYLPGETAYLQMAVLNDEGHTICDADLRLEIINPDGEGEGLSIDNEQIVMNPECGPDNVIDSPDYYAYFRVTKPGTYQARLTAHTYNGVKEIIDNFYVAESLPYEVERIGPTRIYPWAGYPVTFKVKANRSYKGTFRELVPSSFDITNAGGANVRNTPEFKELEWFVDWQAGETYEYRYVFDAPNVSPEFFLLGPARIGDFEEARYWQIASDAEVTVITAESIGAQQTLSSSWVEGMSLAGSNFTGGNTYFIYIAFGLGQSTANQFAEYQINFGSTEQHSGTLEPVSNGGGEAYQVAWFDVYTQPSTPEDIVVNYRANSSGYARFLNAQIYAINLDDLDTTDWKYASNTPSGSDSHGTTMTAKANITLDQADGTKDWLIFAQEEVDIFHTNHFEGEIYDGTASYMRYSRDAEDTAEQMSYVLFRPFDNVAQDTQFSIRVRDDADGSNLHLKSRIFALNLSAFEYYDTLYDDATDTSINTTWTDIGSLTSYTPLNDGNQVIFASWMNDTGSNNAEMDDRLQVGGTTYPTDWSWFFDNGIFTVNGKESYDSTDFIYNNIASVVNMTTSGANITLGALGDATGRVADEVSITAFSVRKPGATDVSADSQTESDYTNVVNGGWSSDSAMKLNATASVGGTATSVTFYYELIPDSGTATTTTDEPTNACMSGTAYGSCASKLWTASSSRQTWYNTSWDYRKKMTINSSLVSTTTSGFPVLASTTDSDFAHTDNGGHMASTTGGDIVVTDSDGVTVLNFEREYYSSSTGELVLWIKTDISTSTDKIIYIYYGNTSAVTDLSTTTGVWDDDYAGVWHLDESPANGQYHYDSTNNEYNATLIDTDGDSDTSASGKIDGADHLAGDSGDDFLRTSSISDLAGSYETTISFWAKQDASVGNYYAFWGNQMVLIQFGDTFWIPGVNNLRVRWHLEDVDWQDSHTAVGVLDTDTWHHWAFSFNSGTTTIYKDGSIVLLEADDNSSMLSFSNNSPVYEFGARVTGSASGNAFDGYMDEIRISTISRDSAWIETEYNNQNNPSAFVIMSNEEDYNNLTYEGVVNITGIPDTTDPDGYKWQVKVWDADGASSIWREFNSTVPNFMVDATAPDAPGDLTLSSKNSSSITLEFGYFASDSNFSHYKMFYKVGESGVTVNDTEHVDTNLNSVNYNGESYTTITGLQPSTSYVINIWAYDKAGNYTGATELVVETGESGRANTVMFVGGVYNSDGDTGSSTDATSTFSVFNFQLAESGTEIKSAYVIFESQFEAYDTTDTEYTGYELAFDACQSPCTVNAFTGTGRVLKDDNTTLVYGEAESNQMRLVMDVTAETQLANYSGNGSIMKGQIGYRLEIGSAKDSIASARAILVVTYAFDDINSESFTNTVVYPLDSNASGPSEADSGTRQLSQADYCTLDSDCPLFSYNVEIPELVTSPGATQLAQWYSIYAVNDGNNDDDIYLNLNVESDGATSSTFIHEATAGAGTQGNLPKVIIDDTSGFAENTDQILEIQASTPTGGSTLVSYLMGGEVFETYIASTTVETKTRTVAFPIGVINNGDTTAQTPGFTDVYFPENGDSSGNIAIKKAWFRIISNNYNSGNNDIEVVTQVGDNASSSLYTYNYDVGGNVVNPTLNIYHILASSTDISELELANGETPKRVYLYTENTNATDQGGLSAELMITYTYTSETYGYLANLQLFAGQNNEAPIQNDSSYATITSAVLPEQDIYKTILGARLQAHYLISDSDTGMPGDNDMHVDANMSSSTPVCSDVYSVGMDAGNAFNEFYRDVTSAMLITNEQSYGVCYSNDGGSDVDIGVKMGGQLSYIYQYYNPPIVAIEADDQKKSDNFTSIANGAWTTESEVYLSGVATDASDGTLLNFYYQLISAGSDLSTSTDEPASACAEGTAYASCSANDYIWTKQASTTIWYSSSWGYRQKLTINSGQVSTTTDSFVVLATTTDSNLAHTDWGGYVGSSTGADIIVTDSDGTTLLDFEREYYSSTTGELVIWIETAISSTTNKDLYIYYGNADVTEDVSTTTGIWDDDYLGVWHLDEDPGETSDGHLDSTINANHGTGATGAYTTRTNGHIGYGQDLDNGERIDLGSYTRWTSIGTNNSFTISAWVNIDNVSTDHAIVNQYNGGGILWWVDVDGTGDGYRGFFNGTYVGADTINNAIVNTWQHVVFTYDGTNSQIYVDGNIDAGPTAVTLSQVDENFSIGTERGDVATRGMVGQMDEVRISDVMRSNGWIITEYNNQIDVNTFINFATAESYGNPTYTEYVNIDTIPDSASGYKWQVKACNEDGDCSSWDTFNIAPNFLVDATPPTAPGDLEVSTTTATTITLILNATTTEDNFLEYKIFYKKGVAGVTDSDTEFDDAIFDNILYNGATTTVVTGLESETQYVINIWAYDQAGNKTSGNELQFTTLSTSHARGRSVQFFAGDWMGTNTADPTSADDSDEDLTFSTFNWQLAETEVEIRNAYVIFEAHYEAYADNAGDYTGFNLAFDTCQENCTADAFSGSGRVLLDDSTVLSYDEAESNQVRLLFDVTSEAQLAAYGGIGVNMESQVGYRIERGTAVDSIAYAKAILIITYAYNSDDTESYTNTVVYPLESNAVGDSGTTQNSEAICSLGSCQTFDYNMEIPEYSSSPGASNLSQWFQVYEMNDGNGANPIYLDVNVGGASSDTYTHVSINGQTQGNFPSVMFDNVSGYAENTDQSLEYHVYNSGTHYVIGGEVVETYIASTSATTKTRTVSFPLGILTDGLDTSEASQTVSVYFPENGSGSGVVDVKKAWFRIIAGDYYSGAYDISVSSIVGDNSESSSYVYNINSGGTVIKPSFNVFHVIPSTDYSELETANAETPVDITLFTTNSNTNLDSVSAELMITYTYTSELTGYLTSINLIAGQQVSNGNSTSETLTTADSVFPELRGTETVRAGALLASYLISDSDGDVSGTFTVGSNLAQSSPVCTNQHYARPDGVNGYFEHYKDISSVLDSTDSQAYEACYSTTNASAPTAGAKMNGQLIYTYQWDAVPPELTQNDWRWYENIDSVQPTTALAATNTAITEINVGDVVRFRINVGVTQEDMPAGTQQFKLQSGEGADCTAVTSWNDVGAISGSEDWIGYNNPDPADGQTIPSALLYTTDILASYEEENNSAVNPNTVLKSEFAEWDWVLYNNGATSSSAYCFRMVKSTGGLFDDYLTDGYPNLTTAPANTLPDNPSDLGQYKKDGITVISNGSWLNYNDVVFQASVNDPNIDEIVRLYFELASSTVSFVSSSTEPVGACASSTAFDACETKIWYASSTIGDYRSSPYTGAVLIADLPQEYDGYKWQVKACDDDGECSNWVVFNATTPNFRTDLTPPTPPGSLVFSTSTPLTITLEFGAQSTEDRFSHYEIYYRAGLSTVTTDDNPHSDSNLNSQTYGGESSTTVINLSADTTYVFNIWAYDLAGNVATATAETQGTTTPSFTPPIGSFSNIEQRIDGSGIVDILIQANDPDNDDTLKAKIMYRSGTDCDFSGSYDDPLLDDNDANISATWAPYPKIDNDQDYQVGTSTEGGDYWIMTSPGANFVAFDWFSYLDESSANGNYCMGMVISDGIYQTATQTSIVLLDNIDPSAPGDLSTSSVSYDSIRLDFGDSSVDTNFNYYKMFYKEGTSGVTENDIEHTDSNLLSQTYGTSNGSTTISNLDPNTWYVFNIWAYDDFGNRASATEITIKTNAQPQNISADNQRRSDEITDIGNNSWIDENAVYFSASVHDKDQDDELSFYFNIITATGTFSTITSPPSTACASGTAFTACSNNMWLATTSSPNLSASWYHKDWLYRKTITIDAGQVSTTTSGFPILATTTDSDLSTNASTTGYDILFTASNGTTKIPYEREYYDNTTGELIAWIKTDISSTSNTVIYMYYGNAQNQIDQATTTGVWDSEYSAVWHLDENVVDESSQLNAHIDSTVNNLSGDQYGNNEWTSVLYRGQEFDGINDYIDIGNTGSSINTISFWFDPDSGTEQIIDLDGGTHTVLLDNYIASSTGFNNPQYYIDGVATTTVSSSGWHYFTITTDTPFSADDMDIGRVGTDYYDGIIDEVRIENVERTNGWTITQGINQTNVNGFMSFSSETPVASFYESVIVISLPDNNPYNTGYKWQVMACDDDNDCSSWQSFNAITPNFMVDTIDPIAPGSLIEDTKTHNSVTVAFGAEATELNFDRYRIYYSENTPVTISDFEHTDTNMNYIDYNSAVDTTIYGLSADTTYYFNIWAYDESGRSASATETIITTDTHIARYAWFTGTQTTNGTDLNEATAYAMEWSTTTYDIYYFDYSASNPTRLEILEAGDYMLALTVPMYRTDADVNNRTRIEAEVRVNGVKEEIGVGRSSYARNAADGNVNSSDHLHVLLENLSPNDYIEVFLQNALAFNAALDVEIVDQAGLYVEYIGVGERIFSGTAVSNTNPSNPTYLNELTAYALEWTSSRKDTGYTHDNAVNPEEIALDYVGNYLVYINIPLYGAVQRASVVGKVLLDGAKIDGGQFKQGYIRNANSDISSSIHWAGVVISTTTDQKLSVTTELEAGAGNITVGGDNATIYIERIPTSGVYYATGTDLTSGTDWNQAGTVSVEWGGVQLYDTDTYTHSPASNAHQVTVDQDGNYLIAYNDSLTLAPAETTIRPSPMINIQVNGSDLFGAKSNTHYIRNADGHAESSASLVYLVEGLTAGDIISVTTGRELSTAEVDDDDSASLFIWHKPKFQNPNVSAIEQYKTDASSTIANGAWTDEDTVLFTIETNDPDTSDQLRLYLQLIPDNDDFSATTSVPASACASTTVYTQCNSKIWSVATSTLGDFSVDAFTATATISGISSSTIGYKWQVLSCDSADQCSNWDKYNVVTPNFYVDDYLPTVPGDLTDYAVTSNSITLEFGSASDDENFVEYKIFYKEGTSGVTEDDSAWTQVEDGNLGIENFGGANYTTITGLASSTDYVFNIWVYDIAGNTASATTEVSTTTAQGFLLSQTSYIWENDDGSTVNDNGSVAAIDATTTEILIGERLNLRIQIENNGGDTTGAKVYKLQFQNMTDSGAWTDVGASTEISYGFGLSGVNGDSITSRKAAVNANTRADGTWHENTNLTGSYTLVNDYFTEFVFALETSNALVSKDYRFRLYNNTDDEVFNVYDSYPGLVTTSTDVMRYSKVSAGSLPTVTSDLLYYYDPQGYNDIDSDDGSYDPLTSSSQYPIAMFAVKHDNNTDAMTATWNGRSSVNASTNKVYLQVFKYGSPDQWVTVASNTTALAGSDFDLTGTVNAELSSHYDGSYWVFWRVYQDSGDQTLESDTFNVVYSAPTEYVDQVHFRWRNDNGTESTATWREAIDLGDPTNPTVNIEKYQKIRLRLETVNEAAGNASSYVYQLEYASSTGDCSTDPGYWDPVSIDGTMHWSATTSAYFANGDSITTSRLTAEATTFVNGYMVASPAATSSPITLTEDDYTELEYAIYATPNATDGGTYCFRATNDGTVLDNYTIYALLTLGGVSNITPSFSVLPSDGGSASTTPTDENDTVAFSATAGDPEGDDYYLAICKTNSVTAGNDGPPTCTAGEWCISDVTASSTEATCEYTAVDASESLAWYAFVCDKKAGLGVGKCSSGSQGSSDIYNRSPFSINHIPAFTAVQTVTDDLDPGETYTIRGTASDDDALVEADTLKFFVCTEDSANFNGCLGASNITLCSVTGAASPDPECTFATSAPAMYGTYNYYAFIFDSHNLASDGNSQSGTYQVHNAIPTVGTLVLNDGNPIIVNLKGAPGKEVSTVNSNISDKNGCQSLVSATARIFVENVTETCDEDDNDCYHVDTGGCEITDCASSTDQTATITCTTTMKYFAISTADDGTSNPNEQYEWFSYMNIFDGGNYEATTSETGVELNNNLAIGVIESSIDFGSNLYIGQNSGTINSTSTVENIGNCPLDINLKGDNMVGNPSGTILAENLKWSLVPYFDCGFEGNVLSNSDVWVETIELPKATTTEYDVVDPIYWGIGIPSDADSSSYEGKNYYTSRLDDSDW